MMARKPIGQYSPSAMTTSRPGAADAQKIKSLHNGKLVAHKPPAPICVGVPKAHAGFAK